MQPNRIRYLFVNVLLLVAGFWGGVLSLRWSSLETSQPRVCQPIVVKTPVAVSIPQQHALPEVAEQDPRPTENKALTKAPVEKTSSTIPSVGEKSDGISISTRVQWRISSIEKFVTLDPGQRSRLISIFTAAANGETPSETIDDILEKEDLELYRSQVKAAFARAAREDREKEIYYLSRKLGLTEEQERGLFGIYDEVEKSTVEPERNAQTQTKEEELTRALENEKRKQELLLQKVKDLLPKDQYEAFIALESDSAAGDLHVFHSSS